MERKLTRFLTLLISLLMLVSVCTATVFAEELKTSDDPQCYLHGDVNGDGKVGSQDAIYALYYAMWYDVDETLYPAINQEFDFTGEGEVSAKDALYLLWASMGDENYKLEGDIHEYYKPYWTWDVTGDAPVATLNVRCGCGEPIVLGAEQGVTVTSVTTAEANCVAPGKKEHTAKVTYQGVEYTSEPYVEEIAATAEGHDMVGTQGCETESVCSLCGHTMPALGHSWVLNAEKSVAATCTAEGQQWYDCACGDHYTVTVGKVPHTHAFSAAGEPVLKEGTTCTYVITNTYKCVCGDEITRDSQYDKHSYKAVVTQQATCNAAGVKTYVCEHCGADNGRTEQIPVNADAHSWGEGVLDEATGITTYSCSVCGGTKTTVTVARDQEISNDQLSNELQLENANVSLDEQTVAGLDAEKTVQISVEPTDKEAVSLTEEQKAQVGTNTIYDFKMSYNDGQPVTNFDGYVTVSLPYTLSEGEDIDAIDVWFISDEGELEQVYGTYANGYVTFKTNHFSYYTVTRLTPAERCGRYGHIWIAAEKAATCTEEGYSKDVCQRCGSEANAVAIPALDHSYVDASDVADATCTEAGLKHQVCERCSHEVKEEIPALGHNLVADQANSQEADCYKPGKVAKCCDRDGCDYVSVEELPQLKHDFGENPKETLYPDCTTGGYDHQKCDLCGQVIISNETAPLGHDYGAESWTWNEDQTAASAKLVCKINPEHTMEVKAAVSVKTEAATCTGKGYVTRTALVSHNKKEYTDSISLETDAVGHKTSGDWMTTGTGHHRICSVCGEKADQANHTWNTVVTKEATCASTGTAENTCIICGYTVTETVPATGLHNLVDGACTVCDFTQDTCEHIKMNDVPFDLSGYDICEGIEAYVAGCACGENERLGFTNSNCNWGEEIPGTKKLADGREIEIVSQTCAECGLTLEYSPMFWTVDEEICRSYYSEYYCLSIDGQTIKETIYVERSGMMYWDHRATVVKETIDLSTLGMCGGKLQVYTCSCGVALQVERVDNECDFSSGNCTVCGVREYYEYIGSEDTGCVGFDKVIYTLSKDDQTLYTCDCKYAYASHNEKVVKYVMDGESCEEGVEISFACADCDFKETVYYTHHATVIEEMTDLTGYGSCATASHQFVCPCGAEKMGRETYNGQYVAVGELAHDLSLVSEDPDAGISVYLCSKCNYTETVQRTTGKKGENCLYTVTNTFTYTDGKGHTYSYVNEYTDQAHSYETEWVLLGDSCVDGVERRQTCTDCGESYVNYTYYDHQMQVIGNYDLSEYGVGGGATVHECLCKEYSWIDADVGSCAWEWVDGDEFNTTWKCNDCGAVRELKQEVLVKIDDCHRKVRQTYIFSKDGEELLKLSNVVTQTTHRDVYSFELLDPAQGCEGGYHVTETCLNCDETYTWERTWGSHDCYPVDREVVSVNQLCGDLELVTYSCACGLETWVNYEWTNGSCDYRWINGKDVCIKCGAVRTENWSYKAIEGETCKKIATYNIVIVRNGKTVCDFSYDTTVSNHKEVTTYTLLGTTCDDGYTFSTSCADCGEVLHEVTNVQYGCNTRAVEIITAASHKDICGDVTFQVASCACGSSKSVWHDYDCSFEHIGWDSITQTTKYQCRNCGLIRYSKDNYEHIDGTCTANQTYDYKFELNGEVIGTFQGEYVVEDHRRVATFNLWGETCDDGYDVYHTCVDCGDVEQWENYGHAHYQIVYYDMADYGMCDGEIWNYGCACGQETGGWGWDWNCDWEHKGYDDATDTSTYYCSECKTFRYTTENGQRDPATCTYSGVETVRFVRDDETLLELSFNHKYESHDTVVESTTLVNPEGDCEDGVIVTERCVDCGYSHTNTYDHHSSRQVKKIDLTDGCGGALYFYACACGENKGFSQEHECQDMVRTDLSGNDENDIYHHHYQDVCSDCGLIIEDEWYDITSDTDCKVTRYETYTITYGGETYVHDATQSWTSHKEHKYTGATLVAGATSCEDGVVVQWTCENCGESGTYEYESHQMVVVESIDLEPYGSYCGATLDLYKCACGQRQRYDIGEDSECDVHHQGISHWIDGVINTSQDTSEGWVSTYSDSYLIKCAVSDPVACGMTIQMSEYWLNENCMAVEYQTWQLGYNQETGSYDREITIATGEKHAYHPYETTAIDEHPDDSTWIEGTRWTCPDCGSYAYHQWTYVNDIQTKNECYYENTLYAVNGENQTRMNFSEYGLIANGHTYETRYYWEEVAADGTKEWHQDEYSNYDFSNGDCKRTRVYTDSDGYTNTEVTGAHIVNCRYYYDPQPTCSQNGIEHHVHDCVVCGMEESHDKWDVDPTCHYWYWDDAKQVYVCSTCELESAVGATGAICLEDLTEETSNVYTIGYWNRDGIDYVPTVSIILDDVTEDKEWVLTGISFDYLNVKEDGVRALTFTKAEAQAAAEAKLTELSYTGSYAIRISFVPTTDDNTLDYAITFDSQNTAQ